MTNWKRDNLNLRAQRDAMNAVKKREQQTEVQRQFGLRTAPAKPAGLHAVA